MTDTELRTTIGELVQRELGWSGALPAGELAAHLDSVQRLTLVVALEDHFQVCFDLDDDSQVRTLDDLVRVLQGRLAEGVDG